MTLRVLVADDELLARKRLIRLLSAISEVDVVGEGDGTGVRLREVDGHAFTVVRATGAAGRGP